MKTVLPLSYFQHTDWPVFFLAGPIQGAEDWHTVVCEELQKYLKNFYVAIPKKNGFSSTIIKDCQVIGDAYFSDQISWERYYLEAASKSGGIIFWLPNESSTHPRTDGNPYAMDTRGELGEWRGRWITDRSVKFFVGGENKFPGLKTIVDNFVDVDYNFKIYNDMQIMILDIVRQITK